MSQIITGLGTQRIPKGPIVIRDIRIRKNGTNYVLHIVDHAGYSVDLAFEPTINLFASAVMAAMTFFAAKHNVVEIHSPSPGVTEVRASNAKKDGFN